MNVNMEQYLPYSVLLDLKKSLLSIPKGRSLRLVMVPVEVFGEAISKAVQTFGYVPFRPVIFDNIPIDMTESLLPECILVADDNTNIERIGSKEIEFYKGA